MIDRQRLREQLKRHEGVRRFVYDDATGKPIGEGCFVRGVPTIGVGRSLSTRGLSEDEIEYLLDNDINDCIAEAQKFRWFDSLDPVRQAAIVELVFNLGLPKLRTFKRFLSAVAEQRWPHAAAELRDSLWYRQVKGRGETLAKQILTGEWQ